MLVFIRTSPFRELGKQYSRSTVVPLRRSTDDSRAIGQAVLMSPASIYHPGYRGAWMTCPWFGFEGESLTNQLELVSDLDLSGALSASL